MFGMNMAQADTAGLGRKALRCQPGTVLPAELLLGIL